MSTSEASGGENDRVTYRVETIYEVESSDGGVTRAELDRCLTNFRETQAIGKAIPGTHQVVVTTERRPVMGFDYRETVVKISVEVEA
jgi:hypothetical protein